MLPLRTQVVLQPQNTLVGTQSNVVGRKKTNVVWSCHFSCDLADKHRSLHSDLSVSLVSFGPSEGILTEGPNVTLPFYQHHTHRAYRSIGNSSSCFSHHNHTAFRFVCKITRARRYVTKMTKTENIEGHNNAYWLMSKILAVVNVKNTKIETGST